MISPEEDFSTWFLVLQNLLDDIESFSMVFPTFLQCMESIQLTGQLYDPISQYTNEFMRRVDSDIVTKVMRMNYLDEIHVIIVFEILQNILSFSLYGIRNKNSDLLNIAFNVLTNEHHPLYINNQQSIIRETMIEYFVSLNGHNECLDILSSGVINGIFFYKCAMIWLVSSRFDEGTDFVSSYGIISEQIINYIKADIKFYSKEEVLGLFSTSVMELRYRLSQINDTANENSFLPTKYNLFKIICPKWLEISLFLINSAIFDKQIIGFRILAEIIQMDKFSELIIDWFSVPGNQAPILNADMNAQFADSIGKVYSFMALHQLISIEFIEKFWQLQKVLHISELSSFFSIFYKISESTCADKYGQLMNVLIDPIVKSIYWWEFICNIANQLSKKKGYETYFYQLLMKIWDMSTTNNEFKEISRKTIPALFECIQNETESVFMIKKVYESYCMNGSSVFYINLLKILLSNMKINDCELLNSILDICIVEAVSRKEGRDIVFDLLVVLIKEQSLILTNSQLSMLIQQQSNYSFVSEMIRIEGIDYLFLENFFMNCENIDSNLVNLVAQFINKVNSPDNWVSSYPFEKEYLLWHFITKSTSVTEQFSTLLCSLYYRNNMFVVSDYKMIDSFSRQWLEHFKKNPNAKKALLDLLYHFLCIIEADIDLSYYQIFPHKANFFREHCEITVVGNYLSSSQTFSFPKHCSFVTLFYRLSKLYSLPPNSICLSYETIKIHPFSKIGHVSMNTQSIIVVLTIIGEKDRQWMRPERNCFPSVFVTNSEIMNVLLQLLYENDHDAKKVLDYLPTSLKVIKNLSQMLKVKSLCLSSVFPHEKEDLYSYMLDTILLQPRELYRESLERVGAFHYIISLIPELNSPESILLTIDFIYYMFNTPLYSKHSGIIIDSIFRIILFSSLKGFKQLLGSCYNILRQLGKEKIDICFPFHETQRINDILTSQNLTSGFICPEINVSNISNRANIESENSYPDVTNMVFETGGQSSNNHCANYFLKDYQTSEIIVASIKHLLLLSNNDDAKTASSLLTEFPIPSHYFSQILPTISGNNYEIFLETYMSHILRLDKRLDDFIRTGFNKDDPLFSVKVRLLHTLVMKKIIGFSEIIPFLDYISCELLCLNRPFIDKNCLQDSYGVLACSSTEYLIPIIMNLDKQKLPLTGFGYNGDDFGSQNGQCGLTNLGMTCFLNSTLQQFFAIPELRDLLFTYNGEDKFLLCLKDLFLKMRHGTYSSINPATLIENWVSWDGSKLNPRNQQDAAEFVQMLIDKLEPLSNQIHSLFCGKLINSINGIDVEYKSAVVEPFSTLAVEVDGLSSLNDSLNRIHDPDFFTDKNQYYADSLKQKINAKKISFILELPKYLIIQLKRFSFSYQTWVRNKINSILSFPEYLDMGSHIEDKNVNYQYKLAGVIAHSGTANSGHYVSYIRNRNNQNWYIFNDSLVSITNIDAVFNLSGSSSSTNAYLLFYDKEGVQYEEQPLLPELNQKIMETNQINVQQSLFCNSSYVKLMIALSKKDDLQLFMVAFRYLMEICPRIVHETDAIDLADSIMDNVKAGKIPEQMLLHELTKFDITSSMLISKNNKLNSKVSLIYSEICSKSFSQEFFEFVLTFFESVRNKYLSNSHLYFSVLETIIKKNPDLMKPEFDLSFKLIEIIEFIIPEYLNNNPKIKSEYFYRSIDLDAIVSLISIYGIPSEKRKIFLDNFTFRNLYLASVNPKTMICLYKNCLERFETFLLETIEKNLGLIELRYSISLFLSLMNEDSFLRIMSLKCKFYDRIGTISDIAFVFSELCHSGDYKELLINLFDKWFIDLAICDNSDARFNALCCIAQIIGHRDLNYFMKPRIDVCYIPTQYCETKIDKVDEQMTKNIVIITNTIINNLGKVLLVIQKDFPKNSHDFVPIDKFRANNLLDVLGILIKLLPDKSSIDFSPFIEFSHHIHNHCQPYDLHIKACLRIFHILKDYEMDDFIIKTCVSLDMCDNAVYNRAQSCLEFLVPLLDSIIIPNQTIELLLSYFVFAPSLCFSYKLKELLTLTETLSKNYRKFVLHILDKHFDVACKNHISLVIIILEISGEKRPILDSILMNSSGMQSLGLDEIFSRGIKVSTNVLLNKTLFVNSLNISLISEKTKILIWEKIEEIQIPFESFPPYLNVQILPVHCVRYLLKQNTQKCIYQIIQASSYSLEALSLTFPLLSSNPDSFFTSQWFSQSIIRLPIGSHFQVIIDYAKLLGNTDQISNFVAPLLESTFDQLSLIYDICNDPLPNSIKQDEVSPLISAFKIFQSLHAFQCAELSFLTKFVKKISLPSVWESIRSTQMSELLDILNEIITPNEYHPMDFYY